MADFSSGILSGSILNSGLLQTVLDSKLPGRLTTAQVSTVQSMASTTPASLDSPGLSVTNVEADDILFFLFTGTVSCGTSGDIVGIRAFINSDDKENFNLVKANSGTGGDTDTLSFFSMGTGYSGTVSLYAKMWRYYGSGTVYCKYRNYACLQLKARS